jgi:hypothetical protein
VKRSISVGRSVGLGEQVQVADRLAPAPERAGRLDRPQTGHVRSSASSVSTIASA